MMVTQQVTRPEVQVMYVESATGLAGAAEAFDRLEARFPSLKGRRFYGTFHYISQTNDRGRQIVHSRCDTRVDI